MEVAPCYTLFILFKLLYAAKTVAHMPLYIVRDGKNAIGTAVWGGDSGEKLFGLAH